MLGSREITEHLNRLKNIWNDLYVRTWFPTRCYYLSPEGKMAGGKELRLHSGRERYD